MKKEDYKKLYDEIHKRFPVIKFKIRCFKNISEIEEKKLCNDGEIIIRDLYNICNYKTHEYKDCLDFFVCTETSENRGIYYCDVIDVLIKKQFNTREDDYYNFLEDICKIEDLENLMNSSTPVYGFSWGS